VGSLLERSDLVLQRRRWKQQSQNVVFTNGCYDLLHPGHVRLLERAKALGDKLIVAINSDTSVSRLKGPSRPILPQSDRAGLIASLEAVDAVTIFDEETPCELLAVLLPDILVKGADWAHWIAGREIVEAAGGKVIALPLEADFSTTDIVNTVLDLLH
jgi:rfaE bifunctional protein nucleotidyltransferase chain/domain